MLVRFRVVAAVLKQLAHDTLRLGWQLQVVCSNCIMYIVGETRLSNEKKDEECAFSCQKVNSFAHNCK